MVEGSKSEIDDERTNRCSIEIVFNHFTVNHRVG
jgi:hypothetical protein